MKSTALHNLSRRLHIHLGLFFLLFIWLFSLTGLILNHGDWKFASFWEERQEIGADFSVPRSALMQDHPETGVMEFLKISGQVQNLRQTSEMLEFRVESPGILYDLHIDLISGSGSKKVVTYNVWGKLRTLHTFNGTENATPNWWLTNIWRFTMDVVAIGFIIMSITSWIMWYKVRKDYKMGYLILASSFVLAGYFIFWS